MNNNISDSIQSFDDVDRIIHEPARFKIMVHLYVIENADFLFIMNQTKLTQGNLSSHLSKLETEGYIEIKKEFINKKPHTMLSISVKGKKEFIDYCNHMKHIFDSLT